MPDVPFLGPQKRRLPPDRYSVCHPRNQSPLKNTIKIQSSTINNLPISFQAIQKGMKSRSPKKKDIEMPRDITVSPVFKSMDLKNVTKDESSPFLEAQIQLKMISSGRLKQAGIGGEQPKQIWQYSKKCAFRYRGSDDLVSGTSDGQQNAQIKPRDYLSVSGDSIESVSTLNQNHVLSAKKSKVSFPRIQLPDELTPKKQQGKFRIAHSSKTETYQSSNSTIFSRAHLIACSSKKQIEQSSRQKKLNADLPEDYLQRVRQSKEKRLFCAAKVANFATL